ncbi:MAG: type II CAAX endopeptidase family protein [Coriobacteriia bacterium]|nr:type II CAAX endopeptidase family protein [Coriobacteriia bacterium]
MEAEGRFPHRFFVVTFAWSWLIWLPLVLAGAGVIPLGEDLVGPVTVAAVVLGAFGPAVGAFYSLRTSRGKGVIREYLRGLMDLRFGWWGWLTPPLVLGVTTWLAWILPELWGAPRLEMLLPSVWVFPPVLLLMVFLGGGQEELGWRGYILDPLEERLGPWRGNLVLGMVWAVWHVPLFFMPGTSQRYVPFVGFTLVLIGYSYLYAAVREAAGKRTMAGLVAHGWGNAFVPLFPTIVMAEGAAQPRYWIWAGLTLLAGVVAMVVRSRRAQSRLGSPGLPDGQTA